MENNLRGELTAVKGADMQEYDLVDAVARSLHLSKSQDLLQFGSVLFPAMVNSAVQSGDKQKLDLLKSYGADLAASNYDDRTALHVACCQGNHEIVKHLLLNGVSVHCRDRYDRTPLMEAIDIDNYDMINLLIKCGAHLTGSGRLVGEKLCAAAASGNVRRMESYRKAGADLSQADISGRTALHMACLHGHVEIVKYLLGSYVEKTDIDLLGMTPLDYAQKAHQNKNEILDLLGGEKV